jgi:tRNA pseudouridine55 synthase
MNVQDSLEEKLRDRILPVDKSAGSSTYDCIRRLKRVVHLDRVGHAGTLDPLATGLVLILTGEGTKLSNYLMDLPKRYVGGIKIGESTDTQDASGKVVKTGGWEHVTEDNIRRILPEFLGKRKQVPPMFSALKHKGTPLYMLARRGQKIERAPREVETYEIKLLECDLPFFRIEVFCSRGLYIRALAEEIGNSLGVPAHLASLTRTQIGHFDLEGAIAETDFEMLSEISEPGYSLSDALQHIPSMTISNDQARGLRNGVPPRPAGALPGQGCVLRLLLPDGRLGALAEVGVAGRLSIRRVFNFNDRGPQEERI